MARGHYRSIHTVIVDGPDFQALSPGAKLVWYTLKMTLGPSGIEVVPALVGTLMERTGLEANLVEKGLAQLESARWVQRERNVVWMVDGLKHDPHLTLTNANHRSQIAGHLNGLPRLAIIDAFRAHYGFAPPPSEMPSTPAEHGLSGASEMASKMASKNPSDIPSPIREKGRGRGKRDKGEGISAAGASGSGRSARAGRPTWLTPFADAWRTRYGGEMSAGKAVRALSQLVERHGADEVLRRWGIYLAATAAEYANAPKFAETWGRWDAPVVRALPIAGGAKVDPVADAAWQATLALLPQWQRREITADRYAELPAGIRAGLSRIGGFQKIATTPDDKRVWLKNDFVAGFHATATSPTPEAQSA
jgi:hypothetical protein